MANSRNRASQGRRSSTKVKRSCKSARRKKADPVKQVTWFLDSFLNTRFSLPHHVMQATDLEFPAAFRHRKWALGLVHYFLSF